MSDDYEVCGFASHQGELLRLGGGDKARGQVIYCERELAELRRTHPNSFELAEGVIHLADAYGHAADRAGEERCIVEALALLSSLPRTTAWLRGYAVSGLALGLLWRGDLERARLVNAWLLELCATTELDDPDDARWQDQHRPGAIERRPKLATGDEAIRLYAASLAEARARQAVTPHMQRGHVGVAHIMGDYGEALEAAGDLEHALLRYEEAIAEIAARYDPGSGFDKRFVVAAARVRGKLGR